METTMIAGATLPARTYMPDDDTALVQASRGGDVAAFEQLVKRYDAKLLRIAQKVTQNPEDAEAAVQEAFFKAYQKLEQIPRARDILNLAGSHRPERIIYEAAKAAWNSRAINRQQCSFRQRQHETPV